MVHSEVEARLENEKKLNKAFVLRLSLTILYQIEKDFFMLN